MNKTCVIGDLHGQFHCLQSCFAECPEAEALLVAGDFGFFPTSIHLKPSFAKLGRLPPIFFIDGNHDDIPHLLEHGDKAWPVTWLPRGSIYTDGRGRNWLCVGGADSVDRTLRQRRKMFWTQEETITDAQIHHAALAARTADGIYGVISHTAPELFCLPGIDDMPLAQKQARFRNYGWDMDRLEDSRRQLNTLLEHEPQCWIFSHFHIAAAGQWQGCQWHCLLNIDHQHAPQGTCLYLEDV